MFGANHVAARVAFDHGASVAAAVSARSAATALVLLLLLAFQRVAFALDRKTLARALVVGVLVALQSFSLYSAVARIPVAIALLIFATCPVMLVLVYWATGKEAPPVRAMVAMPVALLGLALVLEVKPGSLAVRWDELGVGVTWALAAALSFTAVLFCNAHWLKQVDGRVRTFVMMATTAVIVLAMGAATSELRLPGDSKGWLGLGLLTVLYGTAITSLFMVIPRLRSAASTVALNFEPIAVLGLAWVFLGQGVRPLQILGAFIVVGAIAWLGTGRH